MDCAMTGDRGSSSLSSEGGGVTIASSRTSSVSLLMNVLEGEICRPSRSNQGPGVLGTAAFWDAWYSSSAENLRRSKGDSREGLLRGDDWKKNPAKIWPKYASETELHMPGFLVTHIILEYTIYTNLTGRLIWNWILITKKEKKNSILTKYFTLKIFVDLVKITCFAALRGESVRLLDGLLSRSSQCEEVPLSDSTSSISNATLTHSCLMLLFKLRFFLLGITGGGETMIFSLECLREVGKLMPPRSWHVGLHCSSSSSVSYCSPAESMLLCACTNG